MTIKQQWIAVLGIVAVLGSALWIGSHFLGEEFYDVRVGKEAPGFNAIDMSGPEGNFRSLSDYRGKVVLLNIWATWCAPCRKEMPGMEAVHKDFAKDGLSVVAVSVDAEDMGGAIKSFVKELDLTFDILHDATGIFSSVYRYTGVPETYIIDRSGVIRRKWIGEDDWNSDSNRAFIQQLLAETGD